MEGNKIRKMLSEDMPMKMKGNLGSFLSKKKMQKRKSRIKKDLMR